MPGLIDTHSHAVFGGLELAGADMGNEQVGLDELERRLRAWRDNGKARHGDMLNVSGMHTAYWSQVKDFRARFDHGEWADQPLAFIGSDHHTGWANAAMLKRAGIDAAAGPRPARGTAQHHRPRRRRHSQRLPRRCRSRRGARGTAGAERGTDARSRTQRGALQQLRWA